MREAERQDAVRVWEAATDALVEFLSEATQEIAQRSPQLYGGLEDDARNAEAKREEAARLLAEADLQVRELVRKQHWLDRGSGVSTLGHYPYSELPVPPEPERVDFEQVLSGGMVTVVDHA